MAVEYVEHLLFLLVPYLALGAAGIVLIIRRRTVPTVLTATGFGISALSHTLADISAYLFYGPGSFGAEAEHFAWTTSTIYWGSIGGLWLGSLGLLWHGIVQLRDRP